MRYDAEKRQSTVLKADAFIVMKLISAQSRYR